VRVAAGFSLRMHEQCHIPDSLINLHQLAGVVGQTIPDEPSAQESSLPY